MIIFFYTKNPYESKHQLLINKRNSTVLKYVNDSKAFLEYSNDIDDIYKNLEENNRNKNRKILIMIDYIIADILSNKKLNPIVSGLYIRATKTKYFSCLYLTVIFCCTKKY